MVPLLTAGFGAPASFLYAALRRRSAALGGAAGAYTAGVVGGCAGIVSGDGGATALGLLVFVLTWTVSTVHALVARPRIYPPTNARDQMNQRIVEMARHRRGLREAAREVVREDPVLARELRIGRPDLLPRAYDDGGLIDVNHVPAPVLTVFSGVTPELAEHIAQVRDHVGGFSSAEELAATADLHPDLLPEIAEYAIFL
jgi:Helix-hairpin-helix motif